MDQDYSSYNQDFYPTNFTMDVEAIQAAHQQQNVPSNPNWQHQHPMAPQQQYQQPMIPQQQYPQQQFYQQPGGYSGYSNTTSGYPQGFDSERMEIDPTPGSMGQMTSNTYGNENGYTGFEDEPPLLEELGIDFEIIKENTLSVLNPLQQADANTLRNTDLAGPLVFCLLFGGILLLAGKVHFGYIYGVGVIGCISLYILLNLMSTTGVSASCIVSVLGYCLLPMVLLSAVSVVVSLQGILGNILALCAIIWCSYSSSKLFVSVLSMHSQQLLVAYPCALIYGIFALLTVF